MDIINRVHTVMEADMLEDLQASAASVILFASLERLLLKVSLWSL